jgi:hypothetical protein
MPESFWILLGAGILLFILCAVLVWKSGFSIAAFIAAVNTVSSPVLAVVVILIGCGFAIVSKQYGLDGNTAAGIVGAGIGLLTGQVLSASRTQVTDGHPTSTQQTTGTLAAVQATPPAQPAPPAHPVEAPPSSEKLP